MYNCISKKDGTIHIIEYYLAMYDMYGTSCRSQIKAKDANTFAVDAICSGICKKCAELHLKYYGDKHFIFSRSSLNLKIIPSYLSAKTSYNALSFKYSLYNRKRFISRIFYKR